MVKACSALNCKLRDTKENRERGISFHVFPKDESLRAAWAKATRREGIQKGSVWTPSTSACLCSNHFIQTDFEVAQTYKRLRNGVVPSIFDFGSGTSVQNTVIKSRQPVNRCTNDISESFNVAEHSYSVKNDEISALKRKYEETKLKADETYKKLRLMRKKLKKHELTISNLLDELEKQKLLENSEKNLLQHCFTNLETEMFNKNKKPFSEEMKKFASTLFLYSPKAYEYVREKLNLPSPRTLRRWMENIDGNPGFCNQVFDLIKMKNDQNDLSYKYCSVIIDSMAIRKSIDWDEKEKKMTGFVDYGNGSIDDDAIPVASDVLVIMAVGVLGNWKAPLAYFLVDGVKSNIQCNLIQQAIQKLFDAGAEVTGLTCDGCYSNQQSLSLLGADLDRFNNFIQVKKENESIKIPIFLDTCHMLKLIRNIFSDYRVLKSPSGLIDWKYIEKLFQIQEESMLSIGNKLTKEHVYFRNNKMKVKLAAQVLSSSVATALTFCKAANCDFFKEVDATVEFINIINRLFDILNSRNVFANGYKAPLNLKNWASNEAFLIEARDYLLSLKTLDDKPLYTGRRKTSIIGFVNNINSVIYLFTEYVANPDKPFKYLLTYKWSQDHLELFFGCVRQCSGCNNNPSAKTFKSIFKKMVFRSGVTPSRNSSVTVQDETSMLDISCNRILTDEEKGMTTLKILNSLKDDHTYAKQQLTDLSFIEQNILIYISGFIARSMLIDADCKHCREALLGEKTDQHALIFLKDNGGLIYPSRDLIKVVHVCEKILRCSVNLNDLSKNNSKWGLKLEVEILRTLLEEQNVFSNIYKYCDLYTFLKKIIRSFLTIRRHYAAKKFSRNLHKQKIRQKLSKTVLFSNQ